MMNIVRTRKLGFSLKKALVLFCFLFVPSIIFAQATVTWTGNAGDNAWENSLNWDTNIVPTTTDNVAINNGSDVFISSNVQVGQLTITNSSKVTINTGSKLTLNSQWGLNLAQITSSLKIDGELVLNDDCEVNYIDASSSGTLTSTRNIYSSSGINAPNLTITVTGNLTTNASISCNTLSVTGESSIGANVTTVGNQTYNGSFTYNNNISLQTGYEGAVKFNSSITNNTNTLTFYTDNGKITFTGNNTFLNLNVNGNSSVFFDNNSFQTINGYFTLNGTGEELDNRLIFGGDTNVDFYFANNPSFSYVTIKSISSKDSTNSSIKPLNLNPSSGSFLEAAPGDTKGFIEPIFYFLGTTDSSWNTQTNWYYDLAGTISAIVPSYTDGNSTIIISGTDKTLDLASFNSQTFSLSSLIINESNEIKLANNNLSFTGTGTVLTNNGNIALYGVSGQSVELGTETAFHGDSSQIEYYGTSLASYDVFCVSQTGNVNSYNKLLVSKTGGTFNFNNSIVASDFTINSGASVTSTNEISITTTNGITNNGSIDFSTSTNNVTFNSSVTNNGTILCSQGNTTLSSLLENTGTFTHNNGTAIFNGVNQTIVNSGILTFNNVEITNGTSLTTASDFTVNGTSWDNKGSFTASSGNVTCTGGTVLLVSGINTFYNLQVSSINNIEFSNANTFNNLSITNAQSVKFASNKAQTINGVFTVTGTNANNTLLTTNAASPAKDDETTWWALNGIPSYETWSGTDRVVLSYVKIEYSKAQNSLFHDWGTTVAEAVVDSTNNWFVQKFYWWGRSNTSWDTATNWSYSENDYVPLTTLTPSKTDGSASIVIANNDTNELKLISGTSYNIKSLEINENTIIDFSDCDVSVAKDIKNNGTIKLVGTNTLNVTGSKINGDNTNTSSKIEYYGECSSVPWGQFYKNITFSNGAKGTITQDLSITGKTEFTNENTNELILSGNNSIASSVANPITIIQGGRLNISANATLYIKEDATCTSLELNCPVVLLGDVSTSQNQTYKNSVLLNDDVTLLAGNYTITFESTVLNTTSRILNIGDSSLGNNTNVIFKNTVGTLATPLKEIHIFGSTQAFANVYTNTNQTYENTFTYNNDITLTATLFTFKGGSQNGTETVNKLTLNGKTFINGSGNFGGADGVFVNGDLYIATLNGILNINDNVNVSGNMIVSTNKATDQVNINSEINVQNNFVLLKGKLSLLDNLTVTKDIVLLNKKNNANWQIDGDATNGTSGKEIFSYNLLDRPCAPSLNSLVFDFPDGTTVSDDFDSTVTLTNMITITAGQNFFANGVDLTNTTNWNLKLKDNTDSKIAFAEFYNASISRCNVSCIDPSGTAYLATGNATNANNNTNVSFTQGLINEAKTVYDDVILLSFKDQNNNPLNIENTNNEISAEFIARVFYTADGSSEQVFEGTYIDQECTQTTDGKGNLSSFYVKAQSTWNTDASGNSSGNIQSTDRNGNYKTSIPYINLPRALSDSYIGLRDEYKNRIASYYSATPNLATMNATKGATYTATKDSCSPVLVSVSVGKENHIVPQGNANISNFSLEAQQVYDAHNYIEFTYSEEVDIGDSSLNLLSTAGDLNKATTLTLGDIDTTTNFKIAGLCEIQNGTLDVRTSLASGNKNSLYRSFDDGTGIENQTHKLRLGIASFVDSVITSNAKKYYKWSSYIESATQPSGKITRVSNTFIKDKNENILDSVGTTQYKLPELTLVQQKPWDVTPPSFVPLRLNGTPWTPSLISSIQYEAVGAPNTDGSSNLKALEIHMFDDAPEYKVTETLQWFTKIGWGTAINNSSFNILEDAAADQRGGIRYCTLYNSYTAFTFSNDDGATYKNFMATNIKGGAKSSLFTSASGTPNETLNEDGCYFTITLPTTPTYDSSTIFKIQFDADSTYVTDLAGNRIKNQNSNKYIIPTVNRTSPALNMSVAPCGKDALYVVFSKGIRTDRYKVYKDANNSEEIDALEYIPQSLEIQNSSGTVLDLIDKNTPAQLVHKTENATGFIIKLKEQVDLEDITNNYRIVVKETTNTNHRYDPLSGVTADVTYIQDEIGNFAVAETKHAFTDFAVNVVDVDYAYNIGMENADSSVENKNIQFGLFSDGSWAVHDWGRNQGNYGVLSPNYDIFIKTKVFDGTTDNTKGADAVDLTLHYDNSIDNNSCSNEYNRVTSRNFRIWLPLAYPNIATDKNECFSVDGVQQIDDSYYQDFTLPIKTDDSLNSFKKDQNVSFLFELKGKTVDHFADGTSSPLYVLRLENPNDITSLDLWSFNLRDTQKQRGGISVLNNVINPLTGENALIRTDFTNDSNVNIMVMTLDGNIVKYINRGVVKAGEQYFTWNGRNTNGDVVARGLYFIRVVGNGIDETRKIMVVK